MIGRACRVCRSDAAQFLFQIGSERVVRCPRCSHVYLDVVHTPETIRRMYERYGDTERDFYFSRVDEEVDSHFDSYLRVCRRYCNSGTGELRLLDVGCGNGWFLSRAQKQGFVCEGIETCEPLANTVRQELGCSVHTALLSESAFPDESFDVITMYDVIEHLQDPLDDLRRIHSWLKPGGILFLLTPNNDALLRRLARLAFYSSLRFIQKPMRNLYYPHHLSYFTANSLQTALRSAQLEIVHTETRNQEISRLNLSALESVAVHVIFRLSAAFPGSGGKLLTWARK